MGEAAFGAEARSGGFIQPAQSVAEKQEVLHVGVFENEVLLDQVVLEDYTGIYQRDIDNDDVLDSCEPLSHQVVTGFPANPEALVPGQFEAPVMGQLYEPYVNHSTFHTGAAMDLLLVSLPQINVYVEPFGTLIANLPSDAAFVASAGEPLAVPIPYSPAIFALPLTFQALSYDPTAVGQEFLSTNAIGAPIAGWRAKP